MFCRVKILITILFAIQWIKPTWSLEATRLELLQVPEHIEDQLEALRSELGQLKSNSLFHPRLNIAKRIRILRQYDDSLWLKKSIVRIVEREYATDLSILAQNAIEVANRATQTLQKLTEGPRKTIDELKESVALIDLDGSQSWDTVEKYSKQLEHLSQECDKFEEDLRVATQIIPKLRDWTKIEIATGYISSYPLVPWDPLEYLRVYVSRRTSNTWWKHWWNEILDYEENNSHLANIMLNKKFKGTEEEKFNRQAIAIAGDPVTVQVYTAHTMIVAFDKVIKEGLRRNSIAWESEAALLKPFAPMVVYSAQDPKSRFHDVVPDFTQGRVLMLLKKCLDGEGKRKGFGISETLASGLGLAKVPPSKAFKTSSNKGSQLCTTCN